MVDAEVLRELGDVLGGRFCLPVEQSCACNFVATNLLRDLLERNFLLGFRFEERYGGLGEVWVLRDLM
jgi:hypothetical protein